jgi:hypothetical protein
MSIEPAPTEAQLRGDEPFPGTAAYQAEEVRQALVRLGWEVSKAWPFRRLVPWLAKHGLRLRGIPPTGGSGSL